MIGSQQIDPYGTPLPFPYAQQVARAYRFLDRYRKARVSSIDEPRDFNDIEDSLWASFQNCWHIKEWLRHDPTVSDAVKDAVWLAVQNTQSILVVADLANGSKHFSTDPKRQRVGAHDAAIQLHQQADGANRVEHVVELSDGTTALAIALVEQAMRDWQDILSRNGLLYFSEVVV